jgi:hypothetical protein
MDPLTFFGAVGNDMAHAWKRVAFKPDAFPDIADSTLRRRPPSDELHYLDIVRWLADADTLPFQQAVDSSFGQPPLTVYWHPLFYIEILFWATSTTAVHEHAFAGAFTVLEGSSLETTYRFDPLHAIDEGVVLGNVRLLESKVLTRGTVQRIEPGEQFVHSVFHLDFPSVSIVARTHSDTRGRPQYLYLPPHLAMDSHRQPDQLRRRQLQCLDLLIRIRSAEFAPFALTLMASGDIPLVIAVLRHAFAVREQQPEAYARIVDGVRARLGDRLDLILASLQEAERGEIVWRARGQIKSPVVRLVLVAILKHDDWPSICRLVTELVPARPAVDVVVEALAFASKVGALGARLDETDLDALRQLIQSACEPRSQTSLTDERAASEQLHRIERVPLLRPLTRAAHHAEPA